MKGQLFLCSHRYQFVDVIHLMMHVLVNKHLVKSKNVALVTSSQTINVEASQLIGRIFYDFNISVIVTKRDKQSAANQIQSHLENGDTVFIFYEKHRISAGIWHTLNNLNHNVEINTANIFIRGAPITTWIPYDVVANLLNDIRVVSCYIKNMCYITNKEEVIEIKQLSDRIFDTVIDADEFKRKLCQILYDNVI